MTLFIAIGITYKEICRITDWQLTNDAMRVALSRIINVMSKLGITKKWGLVKHPAVMHI
jgi:hypothetical protein